MRSLLLAFILSISSAAFAEENPCPEALDVNGTIKVVNPVGGYNSRSHELVEVPNVLEKGEATFRAALELKDYKKERCLFNLTGLQIKQEGTSGLIMPKKKIEAWLQYRKGEPLMFQMGSFPIWRRASAKVEETGEKVRLVFVSERSLWISTFFDEQDDTKLNFSGKFIYFDFGDGNDFFGKVSLSLQQD